MAPPPRRAVPAPVAVPPGTNARVLSERRMESTRNTMTRPALHKSPPDRPRPAAQFLEGTLCFTRAGSAFLETSDGGAVAFVPKGAAHTAFPGDFVRASLISGRPRTGRLPEAAVTAVLRRSRETLTAQVTRTRGGAVALPLDARIPHRIRLPDAERCAGGTWVRVRLDPWTDPAQPPTGRIAEIIGPDGIPATDERLVVEEYGLPQTFPDPVAAEAEHCRPGAADHVGRLDLRDRFVLTIDPADSRDFDDALSLRRLDAAVWELGVHVADVSHFVKPGSPLDREAFARGCSTYLPGRVIPMLPERLSDDLCSLKPGVDRLAFTALVRLTPEGEVLSVRFVPSVIRSRRRLTYEQALAIIDASPGAAPPAGSDAETVRTVNGLHAIAEALAARRRAAGSLELTSTEIRLRLDCTGRVVAVEQVPQDAAHRLVEECMLVANEYACRTLAEAGADQIHRVHPEPEYARLGRTCVALQQAGVTDTAPANRADLARLLGEVSGHDDAAVWTAALLRALPRAEYAVDGAGHFGLGKLHYAHFTSPIRRYPDLVTHRLLKAALAGNTDLLPAETLRRVAAACSERERTSQRAERHLSEVRRLRWLAERARQSPAAPLDTVVAEVNEAGCVLYLPECGLYGWLPRARWDGKPQPGQHLQALPARIDAPRRELELMPVPTPGRRPPPHL